MLIREGRESTERQMKATLSISGLTKMFRTLSILIDLKAMLISSS